MRSDLWERRVGWLGFAAMVLVSGAMAQSRARAADDGAAPPAGGLLERADAATADAFSKAHTQYQQAMQLAQAAQQDALQQIQKKNEMAGEQFKQFQILLNDRAQGLLGGENGKYWLGVECREAQPELQAQLGLSDGEGLVVVHVADDSPASKAGLKQHDVILGAGDAKLRHPPDLVNAVNGADGKEVTLKILRAGKDQQVAVTPAERPDRGKVNVIARPGMGMMFAGGGPPVHLPDNFSITFHRDGKNPGTVTVTRGDDKWEVKEDELNKLPDDVRPIAERMMGAGPFSFRYLQGGGPGGAQNQPLNQAMRFLLQSQPQPPGQPGGPQGPNPPDGAPGPNPPPRAPGPQGGPPPRPGQAGQPGPDLMERLEQLDRRLQLLQDEIRGLRDTNPNPMPRMRQPGQPQFGDEGPETQPPIRGRRMNPPGDGDRRGPPDGDRRGPPDGDRRGPPADGQRQGPPPGGPDNPPPPRND